MANPANLYGTTETQLVSTGTGDVQSHSPAEGTVHMIVSVETTDARVTFSGVTPDSSHGHVIPKGALPLYVPVGRKTTLKACSTGGTSSVINITDVAA